MESRGRVESTQSSLMCGSTTIQQCFYLIPRGRLLGAPIPSGVAGLRGYVVEPCDARSQWASCEESHPSLRPNSGFKDHVRASGSRITLSPHSWKKDESWRGSALAQVCERFLLLKRFGIRSTLHGLRHFNASWLLSNKVPLPIGSERLGHANPAITLAIYSHVLGADDEAAWKTLHLGLEKNDDQ